MAPIHPYPVLPYSRAPTVCPRPQEGGTTTDLTSDPTERVITDERFTGTADSVHSGCAEQHAPDVERNVVKLELPTRLTPPTHALSPWTTCSYPQEGDALATLPTVVEGTKLARRVTAEISHLWHAISMPVGVCPAALGSSFATTATESSSAKLGCLADVPWRDSRPAAGIE